MPQPTQPKPSEPAGPVTFAARHPPARSTDGAAARDPSGGISPIPLGRPHRRWPSAARPCAARLAALAFLAACAAPAGPRARAEPNSLPPPLPPATAPATAPSAAPAASPAVALVDPTYASWAAFRPGTVARWRQDSELGPNNKSHMEITTRLIAVTPGRVVLETRSIVEVGSSRREMPTTRREYPAQAAGPDRPAGERARAERAGGGDRAGSWAWPANSPEAGKTEVKEGEEEIEAAGRKYPCHAVDTVWHSGDGIATVALHRKVWTSDQVPGRLVRMELTGEGALKMSTRMELVEVKAK